MGARTRENPKRSVRVEQAASAVVESVLQINGDDIAFARTQKRPPAYGREGAEHSAETGDLSPVKTITGTTDTVHKGWVLLCLQQSQGPYPSLVQCCLNQSAISRKER
jgi:invasion protein IalB